jgi:hypothetical protein
MMYDTYIMKRTQIYLELEQSAALADRAHRAGTTSSHLIREAVAEYLTTSEHDDRIVLARQRASIEATFGTLPRLDDAATYLTRVRSGEAERQVVLDEHRAG